MCRVLAYLGEPILLDDLLYKPDSSLVKQSYHPRLMGNISNLAGFGMAVWDAHSFAPEEAFLYKTTHLPFYDLNLKRLSQKIRANCLLAHVRGVHYMDQAIINEQNVHPFMFPHMGLAFAHNGNLADFARMKAAMSKLIPEEFLYQILGNTDSEWMYALFLTNFFKLYPQKNMAESAPDEIVAAVIATLRDLADIRRTHKIQDYSVVNLFLSTGSFIAASRFVFNFGHITQAQNVQQIYSTLWYTYGKKYQFKQGEYKMAGGDSLSSIIVSSEPLTEDVTTWIEVPEYSMLVASLSHHQMKIKFYDIAV